MSRPSALALVLVGLSAGSLGCELITTVDRSKIDGTGATGGAPMTTATTGSTGGAGGSGGATTTSSAGGAGGSGGATSTSSTGAVTSSSTGGAGGSTTASSSASTGGSGGATTTSSTGSSASTGSAMCVPVNDGNPCTDDVCANGVPVSTPAPAGALCSMGGTKCDGKGACVVCLAPTECPGTDDACQTRTCLQGQCGFAFSAAGTALPTQVPGDCKQTVCDGAGATTQIDQDSDVPSDSNACTTDACAAGVPTHVAKPQGTSCGLGLVCDAAGACVGCITPTDCGGSDDECKTRTCTNNQCGFAFTAAGTLVAAQTAGNCLKATCDGAGTIINVADSSDVPPDDGNACTDEACNLGAPVHPAKANGTSCNDGNACTQADACQAGTCVGSNAVTCAALDQCHSAGICDPTTGACSNPAAPNGFACNDGDPCTQTDTCQAGTCSGANAVSCGASDQCHLPGVCDSTTGLCSNPVAADGSTCDDGNGCTQTDTCQAGACQGANPITCTALDECHVVGSCNAISGLCSNPPGPAGVVVAAQTPNDCLQSQCDGAGNIVPVPLDTDLPVDGSECTDDVCTAGVPSNPPRSLGSSCTQNNGSVCDGAGACVVVPQLASTTPADGAAPLAGSTIAVTFTTAMNPATLTGQSSAGACSGSIQASLDDFATCIAFDALPPVMSGANTTVTLTAAPGLLVNRSYKLRVTTAATSASNIPLAAQYTQATGFTTTTPNLCDGSLVISQLYGAGGNNGAVYLNDFVELHNRGTTPVNLAGLSLHYASAVGTTWSANPVLLSGTIPAGGYFLVQLASGGTNGVALPTADLSSTSINMSGTSGKIALINGITPMPAAVCPPAAQTIDLVAFGAATATCTTGTPTAVLSATTGATRLQSGCASVGSSVADFSVVAPTPRNSATAAATCACAVLNESNTIAEANFCDLQSPLSLSVQTGTSTGAIFGQVYEPGTTDPAGADAGVRAQLGYGPATANPEYEAGWSWINATYNVQSGNNDEYQASFTAPAVGSYRYIYRFSLDQGVSWTFCDSNTVDGGSGANGGETFNIGTESVLTVTP